MVCQIEYKRPYSQLEPNENLDGDILAIRLLDETPEPGLRTSPGTEAAVAGRAVDSTHVPTRMLIGGGCSAVTDHNRYNGLVFVSTELKALVEGLEPGIHQFFPVELVDQDGRHLADHWFWVVCNRIDSVDRALTAAVLWKGVLWRPARELSEDELPVGTDRSRQATIVFNSQQIGAAHFWRDKYLSGGGLYCSDRAANLIREAALTGIELIEQETV